MKTIKSPLSIIFNTTHMVLNGRWPLMFNHTNTLLQGLQLHKYLHFGGSCLNANRNNIEQGSQSL